MTHQEDFSHYYTMQGIIRQGKENLEGQSLSCLIKKLNHTQEKLNAIDVGEPKKGWATHGRSDLITIYLNLIIKQFGIEGLAKTLSQANLHGFEPTDRFYHDHMGSPSYDQRKYDERSIAISHMVAQQLDTPKNWLNLTKMFYKFGLGSEIYKIFAGPLLSFDCSTIGNNEFNLDLMHLLKSYQKNPSVRVVASDNTSFLWIAILKNNLADAKKLLDIGFDISAKNIHKQPILPLYQVSKKGKNRTPEFFVELEAHALHRMNQGTQLTEKTQSKL